MYIPAHFREDDLTTLQALMREYSFATLVSATEESVPIATPLPFLLESEPAPYSTLKAHMALGNPQWHTSRQDREVLVLFQGPHAYISPSWYEETLSVPTWNYATVHAYGIPRTMEDPAAWPGSDEQEPVCQVVRTDVLKLVFENRAFYCRILPKNYLCVKAHPCMSMIFLYQK